MNWPRPVLPRASSAAMMPWAAKMPAEWSTKEMPATLGSSRSVTRLIMPLNAWPMVSKPGLSRYGPLWP